MELNIELITGDVRQINNLDFLVIGHKNKLKQMICQESGGNFQSKQAESMFFPHQYEILEAPDYKWKRIVSIKFRANNKISEAQFARIANVLSVAIKDFNARSVGILPPTWRNPKYCALGVIHAVWLIGYSGELLRKSPFPEIMATHYPNLKNTIFKIVSQTGTKYFEDVLENDYQVLWDFIKKLCDKNQDNFFFPSFRELNKSRVKFNIIKKELGRNIEL